MKRVLRFIVDRVLAIKERPHEHTFDFYEVLKGKIDPKCTCGKTLYELRPDLPKRKTISEGEPAT